MGFRADHGTETCTALKRADLEDSEVGRKSGREAFGLRRRQGLLEVSDSKPSRSSGLLTNLQEY